MQTVIARKKRGPAPTGKGELIGVRIHPKLWSALDEARHECSEEELPSRPEMIRRILHSWLIENSFMSSPDEVLARLKMRSDEALLSARNVESRIRASSFLDADGVEDAVKTLYRDGGRCGGSDWPSDASSEEIAIQLAAETALNRAFDEMWERDSELARRIDWPRADPEDFLD
ncbi:hypothetical protein D3Y55_05270 [Mesorhizobium sp. DCY119]|nr:hypothetical protein D3Y55_05270 [Mesorhizobium sp. DCY119]